MADGGNNVFVYMGGDQEVPHDVTHVIIDRSVRIILRGAFQNRTNLISVETHEGIERIEMIAFHGCISLRKIKLIGVREVEQFGFFHCPLTDVEFGNELDRIGNSAFRNCGSLQKIKMPTVRIIEAGAFADCKQLTDVECGCNLERIQQYTFYNCPNLRRIVIPLRDNMIPYDPSLLRHDPTQRRYSQFDQYNQFDECANLTTVDLVGGIHKTISSLLLESWQTETNQEINRINQDLLSTSSSGKTDAIRRWIRTVIDRVDHYKAEHYRWLKEDMALLELAVWKTKLDEKDDDSNQKVQAKRAKIDVESARNERRIKSGADIIIRNVLPFLQLLE